MRRRDERAESGEKGFFSALLLHYLAFRERRESLLSMNARNLEIIFESNPRRHFPLVNDKCLTKEILGNAGIGMPRTLGVIESFLGLGQVGAWLDKHAEFVIKPACGSGGNGVFITAGRAEGGVRTASGRFVSKTEMERHIGEILFGSFSSGRSDKALVEERLHPHPFFRDFYPVGLADMRVILYGGRPVMSMLRLPTAGSKGTANLHQGGVGVGVDLDSGLTVKAVCKGKSVLRHPDSGRPLIGAQVPNWEQVVMTSVLAARQVPLGYVGADIVMNPEGQPLVLELNARPGLQIQNAVGIGLRSILLDNDLSTGE